MQTNLWRLTPELAGVLAEYRVPLGSSLDGPRVLNDHQRGPGYFEKTMRGYRLALDHGLQVSFICTFTAHSARYRDEIVAFFVDNVFTLKLHPSLPSLRSDEPATWALAPQAYGDLLVHLLDLSIDHGETVEVMNINDLVKSVLIRHGTVCTFVDCMESTYAVGPDGRIYSCYRFVGMDEYAMGHVRDRPTREDLVHSRAGELLREYTAYVECGECRHLRYCRGGCPYNAIVPGEGAIQGVDPYCTAYRRIFDEITDRMDEEMYGPGAMEMSPFGPRRSRGIMGLVQKIVAESNGGRSF